MAGPFSEVSGTTLARVVSGTIIVKSSLGLSRTVQVLLGPFPLLQDGYLEYHKHSVNWMNCNYMMKNRKS